LPERSHCVCLWTAGGTPRANVLKSSTHAPSSIFYLAPDVSAVGISQLEVVSRRGIESTASRAHTMGLLRDRRTRESPQFVRNFQGHLDTILGIAATCDVNKNCVGRTGTPGGHRESGMHHHDLESVNLAALYGSTRVETRRHHFLGIRVRGGQGGTCHTGYAALLSRSISDKTPARGQDAW
jgi:hypothetical protein